MKRSWIVFFLIFAGCQSQKLPLEIFKSDVLEVVQLTPVVFQHISFLNFDGERVPCNGLIYRTDEGVVVIDTPTDYEGCVELIDWVEQNLNTPIRSVVVTHFHEDCLGGLDAFTEKKIRSVSCNLTHELSRINNKPLTTAEFKNETRLAGGSVVCKYFGPGHTEDNIVVYLPKEKILFGGCLVKALNANKGNLADANLQEWSKTVEKVKKEFSDVALVVPGHGNSGGQTLLDYTIELFNSYNANNRSGF